MPDDPQDASEAPAQEGPEKDPQSSDQPARTDGRQNALVHEGAPADVAWETSEVADSKVAVVQPDGSPVPRPRR